MLFTKNYAGLKAIKLGAFIIISGLLFTLYQPPNASFLLAVALLACVVIPLHFAELSLSRRLSLSIESSLILMFSGVTAVLQAQHQTAFTFPLLTLLCLTVLYFFSSTYYGKYRDFSEDKYIYFVVGIGALLFAFLLWGKSLTIAMSFLCFGILELAQWSIYLFTRKKNKDSGISAFELVIPFSLLILCYLVSALQLATVISTLLIIPVSYYLYLGLIRLITRMHLYAVFLQFLLLCLVLILFEANLLSERFMWLASSVF